MKILLRILLGIAALLLVLVIGAAVVVATIDKRALLAPLVAQVAKATGRAMTIGGEPRIGLSLTPTLVLEDVTLANAPWGSAKEMLRVGRIEVEVALLPLLSRRLDLRRFALVEPVLLLETDRNGVANWTFTPVGAASGGATTSAARVLAIGQFGIERGEATYRNGRTGESTPIRVERLTMRSRGPSQPLVGEFKGTVGQVPLDLAGTFGSLATVGAGQPWPLSVKGEVAGRKSELAAQVERRRDAVEARDVVLTLGSSRIAGTLLREQRGGRTRYSFDLAAETLQLVDLAIAAAAGASPVPTKVADRHVFSATPVSFDALHWLDAQGRVAVRTLVGQDGRRLGPLSAKVTLDNGRLALDDIVLTAYGGQVQGRLAIDAREKAPALQLRLDARQLDLAALLAVAGVQRAIQGAKTDVTLDLALRGHSPREWASSVTGTATARVGAGTVPAGNDGLTTAVRDALDALNPFRQLDGRTNLACAVVLLPLRNGAARVDRSIAVESDRLGISASGSIDLGRETVNLTFAPRARGGVPVTAMRLMGGVRLTGPFGSPQVTIDPLLTAAAVVNVPSMVHDGAVWFADGVTGAQAGGRECVVALGGAAAGADRARPTVQPPPSPDGAAERLRRKLFGRRAAPDRRSPRRPLPGTRFALTPVKLVPDGSGRISLGFPAN